MVWTAPRTWVTGEVVTGAFLNTHIRDNFLETETQKVTTAGDLIRGAGANTVSRLAIGPDGYYLKVTAGLPQWDFQGLTWESRFAAVASWSDADENKFFTTSTPTEGTSWLFRGLVPFSPQGLGLSVNNSIRSPFSGSAQGGGGLRIQANGVTRVTNGTYVFQGSSAGGSDAASAQDFVWVFAVVAASYSGFQFQGSAGRDLVVPTGGYLEGFRIA